VKRMLITGAAGLLGQHLINKLKDDYILLAIDIAESPFDNHPNIRYLQADLAKFNAVKPLMDKFSPELIFNCAGITDVDECEKNRKLAYNLNVKLVKNLLRLDFKKAIHFSSDYVFNGENGPYAETDDTDPIGYYGETKLISEKILENSGRDYVIVRTNVLFGSGKNIRPNFIIWLIERLKQGNHLHVVTDQFNNPIHADNLADAVIEVAQIEYSGIIHIGGADYLSRYEIASCTAKHFGLNNELVSPIATKELGQTARRPLKGGLKIGRAKKLLKTHLLTFNEALGLLDNNSL